MGVILCLKWRMFLWPVVGIVKMTTGYVKWIEDSRTRTHRIFVIEKL